MAVLLAVTGLSASPVRVATLGGDRRLLLDSTNLFDYPALLRQLAHVDIELFDHWAGIAVPITAQHGVALFLNRPDDGLDELVHPRARDVPPKGVMHGAITCFLLVLEAAVAVPLGPLSARAWQSSGWRTARWRR